MAAAKRIRVLPPLDERSQMGALISRAHRDKVAGYVEVGRAEGATVLCGGAGGASREVTEADILALEREAFVSLACEPKSLERMQYMLMNNKPLRN